MSARAAKSSPFEGSPRHLGREWLCYPDLFIAPVPWALAVQIHYALRRAFKARAVLYQTGNRETCECVRIGRNRFKLMMRKGFTIGELLHEWAHVIAFKRYGDRHTHTTPRDPTDKSCAWPRGRPVFEQHMFALCDGFQRSDWFPIYMDALLINANDEQTNQLVEAALDELDAQMMSA